jgi:hypothetical protein
MAMSSLRQLYESSNSPQRIPQPIRGRFRGQPDYIVLSLSWMSAPEEMKVTPTRFEYRVAAGFPQFPCTKADRQVHGGFVPNGGECASLASLPGMLENPRKICLFESEKHWFIPHESHH